ncbi:phosphomannomutase/phosphoglucomutase [Candidatus Berkelbacteria bacterium]|nr:phosphomannomutase/phosphoglucomutase [Candidatus Berkelbacteria bacterium]
MKTWRPEIFHALDIRGIYPSEINEEAVYDIAQAYVRFVKPQKVVLGRDVRWHGAALFKAALKGFIEAGVSVVDIGIISTDMLYFAVAFYGFDGGLTISGSHNPAEYNGIKMVRKKSVAISSDSGLLEIKKLAFRNKPTLKVLKGKVFKKNILVDYLKHIQKFADLKKSRPFTVVGNANFGLAGLVVEKLTKDLPIEWIKLNFKPDGTFPKGRPDPLRPENRAETIKTILKNKADFGVAWDADADRCFFFDEKGNFIEGYFITAFLSQELLKENPGAKIISDPRLTWAVLDTVKASKGAPIIAKTGHTFIKERMRKEKALFAGEMSAHYYFKDNFYAENGMIPFLLMLKILNKSDEKLSSILSPLTSKYFVSGEINFEVGNKKAMINKIKKKYQNGRQDLIDGLSVEFDRQWRFNLRASNTEPLLRLNLEADSPELLKQKTEELVKLISP